MRPQRVTFSTADDREREFHAAVKDRVEAWFTENNVDRHGGARMAAKTLFWIGLSVSTWALLLGLGLPAPWTYGLWAILGFALACIGFNVGHDAIHGSWSKDERINQVLSWSYELIGANVRNWAIKHNHLHHTWTNVPTVDHDIDPGPFLRFHPYAAWRPLHRWQHFYAWALYAVFTLNWVTVGDLMVARQVHPGTGRAPTTGELVQLGIGKVSHFGLLLVVPLLVLDQPWWQVVAGFLLMHAVGGVTLATVFQLAHVVEGPEFLPPDEGSKLPSRWAAHQLRTTANFRPGSQWMAFIVGGLNHQVEHHLFPKICHVHYPDIAPIVEATAKEFGIPYHSYPTMREAVVSHYRLLRELGASPR
jgi:linoleoyl-CoA desaturase